MANQRAGTPPWEQHQSDEIMEAITGIRDGDLQPLAAYLRAGGLPESPRETVALPKWVACEIAALIDGNSYGWFKVEVKGRKNNPQGWTKELDLRNRNFRIGYFVERRMRESPRGAYEGAIQDAYVQFSEKPGTVKKAHRSVKSWLQQVEKGNEELKAAYPDEDCEELLHDGMETLRKVYSID